MRRAGVFRIAAALWILLVLPAGRSSAGEEVAISLDEAVRMAVARNLGLAVETFSPAVGRSRFFDANLSLDRLLTSGATAKVSFENLFRTGGGDAAWADYQGAVPRFHRSTGELLEVHGIRIGGKEIEAMAWKEIK